MNLIQTYRFIYFFDVCLCVQCVCKLNSHTRYKHALWMVKLSIFNLCPPKKNPFHFQCPIESIEINGRTFGIWEMVWENENSAPNYEKFSDSESIFRTSTPERERTKSWEFCQTKCDQAKVLSSKYLFFSFSSSFVSLFVTHVRVVSINV